MVRLNLLIHSGQYARKRKWPPCCLQRHAATLSLAHLEHGTKDAKQQQEYLCYDIWRIYFLLLGYFMNIIFALYTLICTYNIIFAMDSFYFSAIWNMWHKITGEYQLSFQILFHLSQTKNTVSNCHFSAFKEDAAESQGQVQLTDGQLQSSRRERAQLSLFPGLCPSLHLLTPHKLWSHWALLLK